MMGSRSRPSRPLLHVHGGAKSDRLRRLCTWLTKGRLACLAISSSIVGYAVLLSLASLDFDREGASGRVPIPQNPTQNTNQRRRKQINGQNPKKKNARKGWLTELKTPFLNSSSLLQHAERLGASLARAYKDQPAEVCSRVQAFRQRHSRVQHHYQEPLEGLMYMKVPKTASSTLAGINTRIAIQQGKRLNSAACTSFNNHVIGAGLHYGNRDPSRSFLWGSIRDPASRALSRIFHYQISQAGHPSNDESILTLLQNSNNPQGGTVSKGTGGFQLQYLSLDLSTMEDWFAWSKTFPTIVQRPDILKDRVKKVIDGYDFLLLVERMDESLVAMQLLMGLPVGDILFTSAKVGGGYVHTPKGPSDRHCTLIQPTFRSPAVHTFLTSDVWHALNYGDYALYAAANRSLDLTIERLGKERFEEALAVFRDAAKLVKDKCDSETHFPCSANGTEQLELSKLNCYHVDEGCGAGCIDDLAREQGWSASLDFDSEAAERGLTMDADASAARRRRLPILRFDCDQEQGQPRCRSFRPVRFFAEGEGLDYTQRELKRMGLTHSSLPSLTHFTWRQTYETSGKIDLPFPPSLTYFHIRKAAGTTIENAMVHAAKQLNPTSGNLSVKAKKEYPWQNRKQTSKFIERCTEVIKEVEGRREAKAFTVIRDPVERFLSAIAQALQPPVRNPKSETSLRHRCLKANTVDTVQCVLDEINDKGMQLNVHFCPMAVNLLSVVRGIDIEIAVFQMMDLPRILDLFGAVPEDRERNSRNVTYTKSEVLSNMTVGDLDGKVVAAICHLYAIDVKMMHSMGLKVPHCDE